MRAALTTVAITLAVTGGAVAASYAALSDAPVKRGEVRYPLALTKQTPAPVPKPAKTVAKPQPRHKSPSKPKDTTASVAPAKPVAAPTKPSTDKKAPVAPELIKISDGAGALYDPFGRALFSDDDPHDPAAVYDDDKESSWAVTSNGEGDLLLGYVIDLKHARSLKRIELLTDTPGFSAQIFAANADVLPPQITDSRWAHLKDRDKIDQSSKEGGKPGDGKEMITVSDGSQQYRYVLLWFSTPAPTVAPDPPSRTVRLFDLKLYG
jgi:hypothetical protein